MESTIETWRCTAGTKTRKLEAKVEAKAEAKAFALLDLEQFFFFIATNATLLYSSRKLPFEHSGKEEEFLETKEENWRDLLFRARDVIT
ncbi:hypothetical protein HZH66_000558 [Vespula vulgaris]|uniref:Uncharacterized protein n=1 Tax=Vespula vulgaris TaxID=7454 RepID=A0A834NJG0_VESVU|nr:hypothetical protein HZH66_000558 [Vespula vulgaris]